MTVCVSVDSFTIKVGAAVKADAVVVLLLAVVVVVVRLVVVVVVAVVVVAAVMRLVIRTGQDWS
jgi:hypothetical protein